jgi:hypothetical protein
MSDPTTNEQVGIAATVARSSRTLLPIKLGLGPIDLTTGLCFVRAQPSIRHLTHKSLVHQWDVDGGFKDGGGQLDLADFFTFGVVHWNNHDFPHRLLATSPLQFLRLASLFYHHQPTLGARYAAAYCQQIPLRVHQFHTLALG